MWLEHLCSIFKTSQLHQCVCVCVCTASVCSRGSAVPRECKILLLGWAGEEVQREIHRPEKRLQSGDTWKHGGNTCTYTLSQTKCDIHNTDDMYGHCSLCHLKTFSRGCAAKLVLQPSGGSVFTTDKESRAHLEQTCAGILNGSINLFLHDNIPTVFNNSLIYCVHTQTFYQPKLSDVDYQW